MTCPACRAAVPDGPVVLNLTICPSCLASLVCEDGGCRRAMATDTVGLTDQALAALRKKRKQYREAA